MAADPRHTRPGCSLSWQSTNEGGQIPLFKISQHAILRMAQRNISLSDLEYVLAHGERVYRTGVTVYLLRKRDIPENDRKTSEITRLEGTIVLAGRTRDGRLEIITLYRNKSAFRTIQCRAKYDTRGRLKMNRKPQSKE